MIFTVTPNPALDLGGMVDGLVPNEKAYVQNETRFPGGNGINAARMIRKFGVPVTATGFLGGGVGSEVTFLLKQEGVRHRFVPIQGHTRISVTVSDRRTHLQTRLSFPGPRILREEVGLLRKRILSISAPALVVVGGSFPPGFSTSHLNGMIRGLSKRNIPCVVDVPGNLLKQLLGAKPFLIKPNLMEFQDLVGKKVTSAPDVIREARKLNAKVPWICVSSVEEGALLVSDAGVWFGKIPKVQVKTTVGAGDSMVGAMSAQIWKQKNKLRGEELLRWGLAAAASTLITPGTTLGEYKQVLRFFPQVTVSLKSG